MIDRRGSALRRVADALRPHDDARPAFMEGLLLGAMVGAAIAGSTLWNRMRSSRDADGRSSRTKDDRAASE